MMPTAASASARVNQSFWLASLMITWRRCPAPTADDKAVGSQLVVINELPSSLEWPDGRFRR